MANYKFFQKDTGQWIDAPGETWQWEAYLDDGTILKQFGDDLLFHQFDEIDQNKLAIFKMVSSTYPQTYSVVFDSQNMKLIHFYRNTVLNAGTTDEIRHRLYYFGYEKKFMGKTEKVLMVITPSNGLILTPDPDLVAYI